MKTVYLFLATGFEEIEALTIVDMLRRAEIDITTVSISRNLQVEGAHGITVTADCTWVELSTEDADWLILPGGMPGTKHLGECKPLVSLLQRQAAANKNIAAICAAPMMLGKLGLLKGRKATCYPGFEQYLEGAECTGAPVERDGNIITGKGPGAAMEFALTVVDMMLGKEKVQELKEAMCVI